MGKEHKFLKEWKKHQGAVLMTMHPQLSKKEINKFLDDIIEERLVNPSATIHNNYVHKEINVDLLSVIDWFHDTTPIAAGFGVFFKDQNHAKNPAAQMLDNFMTLRKSYKGKLKEYPEGSYEYQTYDRLQNSEKTNANSFYGAGGAPTSNFFNIYTATSVTATGQSLISTTEQAFEAFLANNNPFIDLDDCMNFLENIRKEKHEMDDRFLPNISIELMLKRLSGMFYEYKEEYGSFLFNYLMNIPQNILNRMYFKNNLYEFSYLPKIRNKLMETVLKVEEFKDPNKIPKSIKGNLEDLWDFYKEFVFYNQFSFNRIQRLKSDKRKTVVVVDTDSNMLNLNPWMIFMWKYIISVNEKLMKRDYDQLRFICINMMCYFITNMVTEVLAKYTKWANIPKEYRSKINMKNEYLFTRLILSDKKKRYISSVRLREGSEIYPEKTDIKGLDFMKSSTREETKDYFKKLVREKLLDAKEINISEILREMEKFEKIIMESLQRGERNFLIPTTVKEMGAYKDPFTQQGVRGAITWNYLYPNNTIEPPDKVDLVKVMLETVEQAEKVKDIDKKMYDVIMKKIFGNPNKKIADKGVKVIAIPRNVERVPEWIMPFIDYDTIVNDNVSKFYSVLNSLGIQTLKTSKNTYFSNILDV